MYYTLKCYAAEPFPMLRYHFSDFAKAQKFAQLQLADGYHTVEVLKYLGECCAIEETIRA